MQVCLKGYKIEYEPGAFATELPSASLDEEMKRKVRISAGAYQSIGYLSGALNLQASGTQLSIYIPPPVAMGVLSLDADHPVCNQHHYTDMAGSYLLRSGNAIGIFGVPFYFLFMNFSLVKGFIRFLKKEQSVQWERSVREAEG